MANGSSKPKSQTQGLLIALAILNVVGFLVLYFKVDLDSSLAAGDAGLLSQQISDIQMRLDKAQAPSLIGNKMPLLQINDGTGVGVPHASGTIQNY